MVTQAPPDDEWDRRLKLAVEKLSDDDRENFEERAGIMEFDGGLTRREAERQAWLIVVKGIHLPD